MAVKKLDADKTEELLQLLEVIKGSGKIKKGTNEVTKAAERGLAKLVVIATDVSPKELVMHIPLICEEKNIMCIETSSKEELGTAAGLALATTAVAVVEEGQAKDDLTKFINSL